MEEQTKDARDIGAGDKDARDTKARTGPFSGGPFVFILLPSSRNYIATTIWNGEVFLFDCNDFITYLIY